MELFHQTVIQYEFTNGTIYFLKFYIRTILTAIFLLFSNKLNLSTLLRDLQSDQDNFVNYPSLYGTKLFTYSWLLWNNGHKWLFLNGAYLIWLLTIIEYDKNWPESIYGILIKGIEFDRKTYALIKHSFVQGVCSATT